jgi:hypothetical protein
MIKDPPPTTKSAVPISVLPTARFSSADSDDVIVDF